MRSKRLYECTSHQRRNNNGYINSRWEDDFHERVGDVLEEMRIAKPLSMSQNKQDNLVTGTVYSIVIRLMQMEHENAIY